MRILYLCGDQGIPAFGRKGASTHLREMIAAWRSLGHEVMLAAADLSGDRRADEDFPAIKLPLPRSRKLGLDGRYLLANYLAVSPLRRALADFRPDAIYERSALYFAAGEKLAREARLPRILEVNALLAEEQRLRLHFPRLAQRREAAIIQNAPGVAAISNVMVDRLVNELGRSREATRPYPMAVNPQRFLPRPASEVAAQRAALGWPDDAIVLGYIGSMNHYHRPIWFMDLAEKLLRKGVGNVRFLVVGGSGSKVERFRGRLLRYAEEGTVQFTGSVPQEQLPLWMQVMDVVLVPGAAPQSTPTKIFEAACMGRPLILPATTPIQEFCGANAPFLFPPEEFRAFEGKVRDFLSDRDSFLKEAARFQQVVQEKHTWKRHAESLADWFRAL